ncbi:MAG: hypothetical protein DDT21_00388 [Syntrophomonadaceae bacterium]|nr:hypothetical protein [Bacillota bacterium]
MFDYKIKITESEKTIYDEFISNSDSLYIPSDTLAKMLAEGLVGMDLNGVALRTRSKIVKTKICEVLGYPTPKSFKKTQPRFPSQNFDIYIQKSMNVQIWNEKIDPKRRYVFIRVNTEDVITGVKIINGDQLAELDRTGTLTTKYQATMSNLGESSLLSTEDTKRIIQWCSKSVDLSCMRPISVPVKGALLPISEIFLRIRCLEGKTIPHLDYLQERNRGAGLHSLICGKLGYRSYEDNGTYPDIMNQLIEIKLQTSPTIDLGLHSPEDNSALFAIDGQEFRSRDVRYVIVDGFIESGNVKIRHVHLVNGRDFLVSFPLFGGKVQNAKLQIPLPPGFFS